MEGQAKSYASRFISTSLICVDVAHIALCTYMLADLHVCNILHECALNVLCMSGPK